MSTSRFKGVRPRRPIDLSRNTPVEITESIAPVLYRRKEYRSGSGGATGRVGLASGASLKGKGKGKQIVPAGDRLILELPGGGGLGKPED